MCCRCCTLVLLLVLFEKRIVTRVKTLSQLGLQYKFKVKTCKLQVTACNKQLATDQCQKTHNCDKSCKEMGVKPVISYAFSQQILLYAHDTMNDAVEGCKTCRPSCKFCRSCNGDLIGHYWNCFPSVGGYNYY